MSSDADDYNLPNRTDADEQNGTLVAIDEDLRQRREQMWEMLIGQDVGYAHVMTMLTDEYDVTESAIRSDIHRMENWLLKLNAVSDKSGVSRLRKLRQNRQRRRQTLKAV